MKCVDNIIKKILTNNIFRHHLMASIHKGNYCGIFSLDIYLSNRPYMVSENVFLEFIQKASKNKSINEVFKEINAYLVFEENITDHIFRELLNFAKDNDWIYLSLCHANLSESRVNVLKGLGLDESLWY